MPTPGTTSVVRSLQGRTAAARRWNHPNTDELARDYAAEKIADYIKRTVDAAPPLTTQQRDRLASLLRGGAMLRPIPNAKSGERRA